MFWVGWNVAMALLWACSAVSHGWTELGRAEGFCVLFILLMASSDYRLKKAGL